MKTQRGFGLIGVLIAIVIVLAAGVVGVYVVNKSSSVKEDITETDPNFIPSPTIANDETIPPYPENTLADIVRSEYYAEREIIADKEIRIDTSNWETYRNEEYRFEFKYPATWEASTNDSEGYDYKVIARVVNPDRAGKPDTDVPIEQLLVRSQDLICEGQSINLGGKNGTYDDWHKGFGLIYYHSLCFRTQDWPITILLSAYDESSQVVMNNILSTFKFIE